MLLRQRIFDTLNKKSIREYCYYEDKKKNLLKDNCGPYLKIYPEGS